MATKKETAEKAPAKKAAAKKAPAKKAASGKTVTVTQIHSAAGRYASQRATLIGLGLNKIRRTSTLQDTPAVRGMINAVKHLVTVDEG